MSHQTVSNSGDTPVQGQPAQKPDAQAQSPVKRLVSLLAFPLFLIAIVVVIGIYREPLWALVVNRDAMREWILAQGSNSVLVFILAQIVQVVAFIIPGEVTQLAGGYIFGTWYGTLWSVIGIGIGSAINYFLGLAMGRPFLVAAFSREWVEKVEKLSSKGKTEAAMFIMFVIPAFPKDLLTYLAGMSKMKFFPYLVISMAARFPALFLSSLTGASAQKADYWTAAIVLGLAAMIFFVALFFRDRIFEKIESVLHGKKKETSD